MSDFRDLGAHLNLSLGYVGTTLTGRIREGIMCIGRIGFLPHDVETKSNFIVNAGYSAGLYGCEATHANEAWVAKLATTTANAIGTHGTRRCPEIMFSLLKVELDPWVVIFTRRVVMLRRMLVKHPSIADGVRDAISLYNERNFPGTISDHLDDSNITTAPVVGNSLRAPWKKIHHAWGPIGYLLLSASHYGVAITPSLQFRQRYEVAFSIFDVPYQYLKPLVIMAARRARLQQAALKRQYLAIGQELDYQLLYRLVRKQDGENRRRLRWHLSLAGWSNSTLHDAGAIDSGSCQCGAAQQTTLHLLRDCPLTEHLWKDNPLLCFIFEHDAPDMLVMGLPPALTAPKTPGVPLVVACQNQVL